MHTCAMLITACTTEGFVCAAAGWHGAVLPLIARFRVHIKKSPCRALGLRGELCCCATLLAALVLRKYDINREPHPKTRPTCLPCSVARSATARNASLAAALLLRRPEKNPEPVAMRLLPRGGEPGFCTPLGGDGGGDVLSGVLLTPT